MIDHPQFALWVIEIISPIAIVVEDQIVEEQHYLPVLPQALFIQQGVALISSLRLGYGSLNPELQRSLLTQDFSFHRGRDIVQSQQSAQLIGCTLENVVVAKGHPSPRRQGPGLVNAHIPKDGIDTQTILLQQHLTDSGHSLPYLFGRDHASGMQKVGNLLVALQEKWLPLGIGQKPTRSVGPWTVRLSLNRRKSGPIGDQRTQLNKE